MSSPEAQLTDNPIDIKLRLSALWIAVMFIYAYVDIFSLMRADSLESLLDGKVANTPFEVNQGFLIFTVLYIVPAALMIYFSLTLSPRLNRRVNLVMAGLYAITVAGSCIGEEWIYYLLGSAIEVVLLGVIAKTAWNWPSQNSSQVGDRIDLNAANPARSAI